MDWPKWVVQWFRQRKAGAGNRMDRRRQILLLHQLSLEIAGQVAVAGMQEALPFTASAEYNGIRVELKLAQATKGSG